jgi:hypothetical protein
MKWPLCTRPTLFLKNLSGSKDKLLNFHVELVKTSINEKGAALLTPIYPPVVGSKENYLA